MTPQPKHAPSLSFTSAQASLLAEPPTVSGAPLPAVPREQHYGPNR
jgi:hypothetical protein